jgi:hypothetical protein
VQAATQELNPWKHLIFLKSSCESTCSSYNALKRSECSSTVVPKILEIVLSILTLGNSTMLCRLWHPQELPKPQRLSKLLPKNIFPKSFQIGKKPL